jgi:hypothetical protein
MDIFDQILENLELERELGTRTVEIDRAFLVPPKPPRAPSPVPPPEPEERADVKQPVRPVPVTSAEKPAPPQQPVAARPDTPSCDIAFFTGSPLSPTGAEAMEKIFAAIRKIKPDAVLCLNEDRKAKMCVLLGSDALLKRVPAARPVRGAWTSVDGVPAVMTFSPDYIFKHFQEGSPRMKDAKLVMWNDIKSAVARLK